MILEVSINPETKTVKRVGNKITHAVEKYLKQEGMSIKSEEELEGIRRVNEIVAVVLRKMKEYTKVGMSTLEIDQYGRDLLAEYGANSAPKRDYDFLHTNC